MNESPPDPNQLEDAKVSIEQARWLYEQHEKRADGARSRATTVLTLAGTLVALAPKALPAHPAGWLVGFLILSVGAGGVAGFEALTALKPGKAVAGLPKVETLRHRAADVINGRSRSDPVLQDLTDMLRTGDLAMPSPVDVSRDDANNRVKHLARAYRWLSAAFFLTASLTVIPILIH